MAVKKKEYDNAEHWHCEINDSGVRTCYPCLESMQPFSIVDGLKKIYVKRALKIFEKLQFLYFFFCQIYFNDFFFSKCSNRSIFWFKEFIDLEIFPPTFEFGTFQYFPANNLNSGYFGNFTGKIWISWISMFYRHNSNLIIDIIIWIQ